MNEKRGRVTLVKNMSEIYLLGLVGNVWVFM